MLSAIERDERFRKITLATEALYALFSVYLVISGAARGDTYRLVMALGTFFLYPLFWAFYRIFRFRRGYQMEFCVFVFTFLAYPLGGTAEFYQKIQGFDKVAHTLSGVFVAMLALALYLYLERKRPLKEHSAPTAVLCLCSLPPWPWRACSNCASGRPRRRRGAICSMCWARA